MTNYDYSSVELRTIAFMDMYREGDIVEVIGVGVTGLYKVVSVDSLTLIDGVKLTKQPEVKSKPQANKPWYRAMKHGNKYERK